MCNKLIFKQLPPPIRSLREPIARIAILALILITASCQKADLEELRDPSIDRLPLTIQGSVNQEYTTRVNDNGFATGDKMGIYIIDYDNGVAGELSDSNLRATNAIYTYNAEDNSWNSPATIYWKDSETPIDIYGYYPAVEYISNPLEYSYEVNYRQDIVPDDGSMSNYETSDFLWCKASHIAPTKDVIIVHYTHRMAGVKVQLVKGTGFTNNEWAEYEKIVQIENTLRHAKIDLSNGVPVPYGEVDRGIIMLPQNEGVYRAVVVPQSISAGLALMSVTIDGVTYKHSLDYDMEYQMGKLHNFTLTVNKRESGDFEFDLTRGEISEWENDETSHNFDSNSYIVINVPKAGTFRDVMAELGYDTTQIKNLKLGGELNHDDFSYLKEIAQKSLKSINLSDAKFVHVFFHNEWINGGGWKDYFLDDYLPNEAFRGFENLRQVVLPTNLKHIGSNAMSDLLLTSPIILPEGLETVQEYAFWDCDAEIVMPHTLKHIGGAGFRSRYLRGELILTDNLTYIGGSAFETSGQFYGTFYLPQKLEHLGENAFNGLGNNLSGDIVIPSTMTEIPGGAFRIGFSKKGTNLILHDGVVRIGDSAFAGLRIKNVIEWPASLKFIEKNAFWEAYMRVTNMKFPPNIKKIVNGAFRYNHISGELVLPETLSYIDCVFSNTDISSVVVGDSYVYLGDEAFASNGSLQKVYLGKNVEYIGRNAFTDHSITTFICMAAEPPVVDRQTFNLAFDKCILQVPEASVELYRNTSVWNQFKNITAYKELAFNIPSIVTLDKGVVRQGIIRAQGPWEVVECPDWVTVSPSEGDGKEELTITVKSQPAGSQTREGRIVFSLKGKDYTTYTDVRQVGATVGEDQVVVLQNATKGNKAIPLFLVGEGYCADDIVSGKYLSDMKEQMEHIFSIEPMKSYRKYFTVSTAYAVSPEPLGGQTRFNSEHYMTLHGDKKMVREYARQYGVGIDGNEHNSTVLVLFNSNILANTTDIESNGFAISWMGKSTDQYPYDQRGYILHELVGRAFGKLGPESVTHLTFIDACGCPGCNMNSEYSYAKEHGWWQNITKTNKLTQLPWYHLIFHEKYSSIVDMFEGGCNHARGVYRSENQSVMGNAYVHYFNTISREVLVRRIMECADEEFDFEEFVAKDKIELPN
ncbi:MAG: fimbrillin family protein [Alistipes sp.]|nr:fimbrillin family protein [Alistipes sp.]